MSMNFIDELNWSIPNVLWFLPSQMLKWQFLLSFVILLFWICWWIFVWWMGLCRGLAPPPLAKFLRILMQFFAKFCQITGWRKISNVGLVPLRIWIFFYNDAFLWEKRTFQRAENLPPVEFNEQSLVWSPLLFHSDIEHCGSWGIF